MSSASCLHPDIAAFLDLGLSIHVGACDAAGQPQLARGLAVRVLGDTTVEVLVPSLGAAALIAAVGDAGQVAVVCCQPTTHRTLQLKGGQAAARPARPADWPQLSRNRRDFGSEIEAYGFGDDYTSAWFDAADGGFHGIVFQPSGAWNQTPGPAAGAPIPVHA